MIEKLWKRGEKEGWMTRTNGGEEGGGGSAK